MSNNPKTNVKQVVPYFSVQNIEASIKYYVEGIGFEMKDNWRPEGKLRWCWLELGGSALMLHEFWNEGPHKNVPSEKLGVGIENYFICEDALAIYDEITSRGITTKEPFVGNSMWVVSMQDPDGYGLSFESPTDVPEETTYYEWLASSKKM